MFASKLFVGGRDLVPPSLDSPHCQADVVQLLEGMVYTLHPHSLSLIYFRTISLSFNFLTTEFLYSVLCLSPWPLSDTWQCWPIVSLKLSPILTPFPTLLLSPPLASLNFASHSPPDAHLPRSTLSVSVIIPRPASYSNRNSCRLFWVPILEHSRT